MLQREQHAEAATVTGESGAPETAEAGKRHCAVCDEKISDKASVCPRCGAYERRWKNHLKYWSGVVGLFAFIASALVFVWSSLEEGVTRIVGADIQVINLDTFGTLTLFNNASTDVLVRSIEVSRTDGDHELIYVIDRSIEPSKTLSLNMMEVFSNQTHGYWNRIYGHEPSDYAFDLSAKDLNDVKSWDYNGYVPTFLSTQGDAYAFFKDETKSYEDLGCAGKVNYSVYQGAKFDAPFECVAWIRKRGAAQK